MRRWCAGLVLAIVAATASGEGLVPKPGAGGKVSIPGAPLPPVDGEAVRMAIPIYESILAATKLLGETAALARGYGYMATLYASIGEHARSEQLFDDAQAILEKRGATGRDLGWVHNNRGLVYLDQRRWADGLRSFRAAVAALAADRRELLEFRVIALQNLASTHQFLGNVEASEDGYLEGLEILRKLGRDNDAVSYTTRANLASLYDGIKDFESARTILEDLENRPNLSKALRFAVVGHLGYVLLALHDFDGAEARFKKALSLTAEGSGERAMAQMNLAAMYVEAGDFEQGKREGDKALLLAEEAFGPDGRMTSVIVGTLGMVAFARGDYVKAESLFSRCRRLLAKEPGDGEALAGVTQNLAMAVQRRGDRARSLELSREALDLKIENLERILAFGSEAQRLAYRSNTYPYDQLANLGDGLLLAEAVLTMKGAVLESLLAERALVRASRSPTDVDLLDRIQSLRIELMEQIARGEAGTEQLRRALKKHETALAKRLARPATQERRRVDVARVQSKLGDGEVLVEIIRYQLYEGPTRTPWYGAIVIAGRGEPTWVPLARAKEIDDGANTLVTQLNKGNRGVLIPGLRDVTSFLRSLNNSLWKPLESALPNGTQKVLLSPEGATAFIPWAALLDETDTFLAERCEIAQVGSGRDLLREESASSHKTVLALADGANDLPYSRFEVEQLVRVAEESGWSSTVLINEKATELELFQHPRPRILHFATHGGQLDTEAEKEIESRLGTNPMYRGFLLLGGGKETRESWKRGSQRPFAEDGILTAEEVAGLDLRDTWLTVLSACRTGAGDAVTGEGVLGLRRGFILAGTENLLFSLWSVDDAATAQFMAAFYARLFAPKDLASAFHETQVAELRRWREEARDLSDAVHRAGAFVLTR